MASEAYPAGLRSAVVADVLDALGYRDQCLGADIVPIYGGGVCAGGAYPVRCEPIDALPERPYDELLRALDGIGAGQVLVMAADRSSDAAVWGELVSTACAARGAVGAVTDGLVRDVALLDALGDRFGVYGRGSLPYDIAGRLDVTAVDEPVEVDGVAIAPGDLLVADADGVAVVPRQLEAEVLALVAEKDRREGAFRRAVREGMPPSEAYAKHGVL